MKELKSIKSLSGEKWVKLNFDLEFKVGKKIFLSSMGRVASYIDGKANLLNYTYVTGYKTVSLTFFAPPSAEENKTTDSLRVRFYKALAQYNHAKKALKALKRKPTAYKAQEKEVARLKAAFEDITKKRKDFGLKSLTKRRVYKKVFIHRDLAQHFLPKPKKDQKIVIHMDYNKENNALKNLRWVTTAEAAAHIAKNPEIIKARKNRPFVARNSKLNEANVKLIKAGLKDGKTMDALSKKFKVSAMQIFRIKSGENWSHVK